MRGVADSRELERQGFQTQEALAHCLSIADLDDHFGGFCQPGKGMLVRMLPDNVAVGLHLR